jgi:hypothetical protein
MLPINYPSSGVLSIILIMIIIIIENKLESKVMYGLYIRSIDIELIGEEDTLKWLSRAGLNGGTGSEVIAAQDQALQTK